MRKNTRRILSFTDLDSWREGHRFVIEVYNLTKRFPQTEIFGLVSQMRRSAISITSNIAEGFNRFNYKEKIQFYSFALGSVAEIQSQLLVCRDVHLISNQEYQIAAEQAILVHKLVTGLIKSPRLK